MSHDPFSLDGKVAVITGASKGIGRATAVLLAQRGYSVFAGVRSTKDGDALGREAPGRITPIMLDVTKRGDREAAMATVTSTVGDEGLYALVNNAGIAVAAPIEFVPIEDLELQFRVNVFGLVAVTQSCLPLLRRNAAARERRPRGRGPGSRAPRVMNISSIGGRIAFSPSGPYTASKFALEAISDSLRLEVEPQGIRIIAVEPGTVATPLWDRALELGIAMRNKMPAEAMELYGRKLDQAERHARGAPDRGVPAERVAAVIARAADARRPRTRYLVGADAKLAARLVAPLPDRLRDALLRLRG
jgi:NAD(P)-dependent dehydrogenase (short-subunit alcohol dehydrogenase family)